MPMVWPRPGARVIDERTGAVIPQEGLDIPIPFTRQQQKAIASRDLVLVYPGDSPIADVGDSMGRRSIPRVTLLSASEVLANVPFVSLYPNGELSAHVVIDNGAGGAPSDSPVGTWELWTSGDGVNYEQQVDPAITSELAKIAAVGNAKVTKSANFVGVPGVAAKLVYVRGSGGASSARATISTVVG